MRNEINKLRSTFEIGIVIGKYRRAVEIQQVQGIVFGDELVQGFGRHAEKATFRQNVFFAIQDRRTGAV